MIVKITWLDTADSYVVKLKNKGDSFECALCNSDGRVHSPTRYHCSIAPNKLIWKTVKRPDDVKFIKSKKEVKAKEQDIEAYKELKEIDPVLWLEKYGEQHTHTEVAEALGRSYFTYRAAIRAGRLKLTDKDMEFINNNKIMYYDEENTIRRIKKFMEDYEFNWYWFQKEGILTDSDIQNIKEKNSISYKGHKEITEFLDNHQERMLPDEEEIVERLHNYIENENKTKQHIFKNMGLARGSYNNLVNGKKTIRETRERIVEHLELVGY